MSVIIIGSSNSVTSRSGNRTSYICYSSYSEGGFCGSILFVAVFLRVQIFHLTVGLCLTACVPTYCRSSAD